MPSGFSESTCFPASSAASVTSAWTWFGVQLSTTSTSPARRASRSGYARATPRRAGASRPPAPGPPPHPPPPAPPPRGHAAGGGEGAEPPPPPPPPDRGGGGG